jgi:type I restriction enzyme, R subunit
MVSQGSSCPNLADRGFASRPLPSAPAAVNPGDKFELVFKNLLESLFVERMDQNEEIFVRFMNDPAFQKVVTSWLSSEAYKRLRGGRVLGSEGVV